ncbi:MAG: hypothetical protein GF330_09815 [Candidatus Eisenbacteria bacterium]|nr:hypothetical protein [Candidatus Eisenbacteria bacterium]
MSRAYLRAGALAGLLALGAIGCGGGPRNCLVIPAQIELVEERRTAALTELENTAHQVDRMHASIERVQARLVELKAEKAFLDSLRDAGDEEGGQQQ